jgi:hypothetical protein
MIMKRVRHIAILSSIFFLGIYCNSKQIVEGNVMNNSETYSIKIIIGEETLTATLIDNPTTKDFISLLPLDLKLDDYAGTEKVSYLSKKLSTEDAPSGFDPSVGDITYYSPWGNLAIFYKDFGYAKGLINLGKIDSGIEALNVSNSLNIRIELIK